jgi:UDP:flavonoid glycosyltransferase YjiC (YdhE family)
MSEILFVTWDGGGNVPPALGIARELADRGHRVRFMGHPSQAGAFGSTGLAFQPFPTARKFQSADGASPLTMVRVLGDRAMGADVVAEVTARPVDLIVVDVLLFGVMDELRKAGHTYAVLEHTLDSYLRKAAKGPLALALRTRGLRLLDLIDAGQPTLVPSVAELDEGHGTGVVHTGPVVRGVAAQPTEPTVLLSLSTFGFRHLSGLWQRLLDAVDGLPARVIATTGPAIDPATLRVPHNVELHPWLPHEEVLPQVSAVLSHGGHATMMVALAHGCPMLVIPIDPKTDQPMNGQVVERAGVGLTLNRKASPQRIRASLEQLLSDGPHREKAARLGERIRQLDGQRAGADLLESRITNGVRP